MYLAFFLLSTFGNLTIWTFTSYGGAHLLVCPFVKIVFAYPSSIHLASLFLCCILSLSIPLLRYHITDIDASLLISRLRCKQCLSCYGEACVSIQSPCSQYRRVPFLFCFRLDRRFSSDCFFVLILSHSSKQLLC